MKSKYYAFIFVSLIATMVQAKSLGKDSDASKTVLKFLEDADVPVVGDGAPLISYRVSKLQCQIITRVEGEFDQCTFGTHRTIVKEYQRFNEASIVMSTLSEQLSSERDPNEVIEHNTYYNLKCDVTLREDGQVNSIQCFAQVKP